ncbi:MAG TPA: hypothetical protein VFS34_10930 [Thermoanaerobaculia bacterium]|nr:hypothetical protein [Thermoanaerobaculia bacterium]
MRLFPAAVLALALPSAVMAADSLWSVGGPEAGNVTALVSAPPSAVVYAATLDGGVWKSSDAGAHWSHASKGLPTAVGSFIGIDSVAVDPVNPAIAYAGYFAKGFYRTTDGGASWQAAGTGVSGSVEAIAVDPTAPAIVLAGGSNGVYRSSDHGATFLPTSGMDGVRVTALAIDANEPLSVLAGTDFAGLYLSFNGGLGWVKNTGTNLDSEQVRSVFFDAVDDSTVFLLGIHTIYRGTRQEKPAASARAGAIASPRSAVRPDAAAVAFLLVFQPWFFYEDYGSTACEMTNFSSENKSSFAVASVPVYVATEGSGIYVSTNTGSSFSQSNAGLPSLTIEALADGTSAITSGSGDLGIARSTDGSHWSASNAGFIAAEVQALAVSRSSPSTVFAGTAGALYKSVDAGVSWTLLGGTVNVGGIAAVAVDPENAAVVYAAAGDGGVFKSTSGGASWSPIGLDSTFVFSLAIDLSSGSTIYAGASDGVYKTSDGGAHWTLVSPGGSIPDVRALAIDPVAPSTVYAGTEGSGVFRSTDGGAHWANISSSQPFVNSGTVSGLAVDPSSHATLYAATANGAWKTANGGAAWTEINDGLEIDFERPTLSAITIVAGTPPTIYVGSTGAFGKSEGTGVYRSTNGGTSWTTVNVGLSNTGVQTLAVSSGASPILYAGTLGGGVFRSPPAAAPPPPGTRRIIPVHPAPPKKVKETQP